MALLDLNGIKSLYKAGLVFTEEKSYILHSKNPGVVKYLSDLADKAGDVSTLMNVIFLGATLYPQWGTEFNAPKAICNGCELGYTGIQFGVGNTEWYFLYGLAGDICFQITLYRSEIAPPRVVNDMNIPPSEAVRWNVGGGFGTLGQNPVWYSIQSEWFYMKYTQPSYSTFSLQGTGKNIMITLETLKPMEFSLSTTFTDTNNQSRTMSAVLSANTPPVANSPGACYCGYGLGSFYYSYTDMDVMISSQLPLVNSQIGKGWVDHQLIKSGIPKGLYIQSLQVLTEMLKPTVTPGWLWFSIQDFESGLQYMFSHSFADKFYQNDIVIGQEINCPMVIVYKEGVPYYNPDSSDMDSADLKVECSAMIPIPALGMNLPAEYEITLPGGKKVKLQIATAPNVYTNPQGCYETPSFVFDEGGKRIGQGIIEANFYFTSGTMINRLVQAADMNAANSDFAMQFYNRKPNGWQKLLAILIVLLPVWIILGAILFIVYKKDERKPRGMFMLALLLIVYGISKL